MNRRHLLQGLSVSLLSGKLLHASPAYVLAPAALPDSADTGSSARTTGLEGSGGGNGYTFIFGNSDRDIHEFREFAQVASGLKPYGEVQIHIGELADKSWYEMPAGNSPWHEYANEGSCLSKFFPHPKIAPFIPADWVARNRELMFAKAAVLRELGLKGAFSGDETHFMPAAFFEQYPHLRGPRVDHPRRSNRQEFSWCVDLEETRDMIEWMTAELKRQVPEIKTMGSYNNDSGGGLCWAGALYSGPNGPNHCAHRSAGPRVRDYMEAIHRGAIKGGGDVLIQVSGYFCQNEGELILHMLPPNTYLEDGHNPASIAIGTLLNETYPVKSLIDPVAILSTLEHLVDPAVKVVGFGTSEWYDRANDTLPTVEKLVEMQQDCLAEPTYGFVSRFAKLQKLASKWGGKQNGDAVVEAFCAMNEAFLLKNAVAPQFSNFYVYVSTRYITRPLLFKPDVLKPEDESDFLPYVFNVSASEARNDYADMHGGRITGPASWDGAGLQTAMSKALHAAELLEGVREAPSQKWLQQSALSLRMWASGVRSMNNFYFAQLIRDRSAAAVVKGPRTPSKESTWAGDSDYLAWNSIQRDEFDNTNELIALLQNGGMELVAYSQSKKYEDTFLLGPDLIEALHEKTRLMEREWLDAGEYLTSPLK
jgi:hypothetical protein